MTHVSINPAFEKWITAVLTSNSDECLLWPYGKTGAGYGVFYIGGNQKLVHRHVCVEAHGEAPEGKTDAAHSCGNGHLGCANPRHLRWTSRSENVRDCVAHGTSQHGERNSQAKLREDDIRAIRASSDSRKNLAVRYGVSHSCITLICQRKNWAHVDG